MASLPLHIGASAPLRTPDGQADTKAISALVRDLTTALPTGAVLDAEARETLRAVHPFASGECDEESDLEDFEEAWQVLLEAFPEDIGVRLGVGDPQDPMFKIERKATFVQLKRRKIRHAVEFLYGPRR